jgi:multimeric flavodoxin WrbA
MNILFVNGSPKPGSSASGAILDSIRAKLGEGHEMAEVQPGGHGPVSRGALDADAIVISFPLYVDGLPSALLEWLTSFAADESEAGKVTRDRRKTAVFAVCNCGFHEGAQTRSALRIVRNFAAKTGFSWRGGLGVGSGGMVEAVSEAPENAWIKREVSRGIAAIALEIQDWGRMDGDERGSGDRFLEESLRYVSHGMPRFAYILAAHAGWRSIARRNGLSPQALRARPMPA